MTTANLNSNIYKKMKYNPALENTIITPNQVIGMQLDIYFPFHDLHSSLKKSSSVKN